ncbi:embryonic protein UVS.2-like [Watersipora subatra]|uniref:embryonic protein UVS.2-like n=1 Tax=Watersipora subatra TaxID=2589382 RepID=UPI00355BDE55
MITVLEPAIVATEDCHGDSHLYEDNNGHLLTNNYPGSYPPNCEWTVVISATSGNPIILRFEGFSLGEGDYLQVFDNETSYTETWRKDDPMPTESLTLGTTVSIKFSSDDTDESFGVKIVWSDNEQAIVPDLVTPSFSGTIHNRNVVPGSLGYIQSLGYPDTIYISNTDERWLLTAPAGSRVAFVFKYFKTETGKDKLKIYSGQDSLTEELIGEYSGNLNYDLPPPLISPSNWVHVHFKSNNYVNYKGFNLEYSIYESVTATIVILLLLFTIVIVALLVYCFWYKPKREAEMSSHADSSKKNAGYANGAAVRSSTLKHNNGRPLTSERPGTGSRPKSAINKDRQFPPAYGTVQASSTGRPGTAGRPSTAARPGTAGRPDTAARPGTAERPGTAARPGTAGRPSTAARPGITEASRPGKQTVIFYY